MTAAAVAPADLDHVRREAEAHLRALVGSEDAVLRDDQWTAIEALAVRPAPGAGRAADRVGQVGGLLRSDAALARPGAGPTVIVSPLLALMRNQIAAAERAGIRAVTINSTNIESWDRSTTRSCKNKKLFPHPIQP